MRCCKREVWRVGIAIVSMVLLLLFMLWVPLSVASAHQGSSNLATLGTVTVQATPTGDATVTALTKLQLTQQVAGQQHTWDNWLWSNAATVLSSFLSTLVIVIGALFGLWRWRRERQDSQDKELKERRDSQDKELKERRDELEKRNEEQQRWLKNQETEREKRAEERFQAAVTGLGDEKEGARIGAAILLRTFLRSGYEQFYTQTFDLAVANLRLPRTPNQSTAPSHVAPPLNTLSQALSIIFKEGFHLARDWEKKDPQFLDATGIQLDNAYMKEADLKQAWMPQASLQKIDLSSANLIDTELSWANLSEAKLLGANLVKAKLLGAKLIKADLTGADLSEADLVGVDLSEANLLGVKLRKANLALAKLVKVGLVGADLTGAYFDRTDLSGTLLMMANFREVNLNEANLSGADLSGADLRNAKLNNVSLENVLSLKNTNLRGVTGLTKEQLEACKAKGAIIDEEPKINTSQPTVAPSSPPQSNDAQAPSAQGSVPPPDPGGSSATSAQ